MAKSIQVTRWIDAEGFEHTTKASAEYEDARNKVLKACHDLELGDMCTNSDIAEWISMNDKIIEDYINKTRIFRVELGRKIGKHKA